MCEVCSQAEALLNYSTWNEEGIRRDQVICSTLPQRFGSPHDNGGGVGFGGSQRLIRNSISSLRLPKQQLHTFVLRHGEIVVLPVLLW